MRLKSIKIYGFKDENRVVNIELTNMQATVIYGRNGCGKTSLLRIIHGILAKDEDILLAENVMKVKIEYLDNEGEEYSVAINRTPIYCEENNYDENSVIQKYSWNDFDNSKLREVSSILFGVNRGITSKREVLPEQIERYFMTFGKRYRDALGNNTWSLSQDLSIHLSRDNTRRVYMNRKSNQLYRKNSLLDKIDMKLIEEIVYRSYKEAQFRRTEHIKSVLVETLAYVIYPNESEFKQTTEIQENFTQLLQNNREKLLEILSLNNEDLFQEKIIKILRQNDIDIIIEECKNNNILLSLLINMIKILEEDTELDSINKLKDIFNSQIEENKRLVIDDSGVFVEFYKTGAVHGIQMLSSGEKQLLTLLAVILIESNKRDIIMIDEPELSLNLKWQREIINILTTVAPNTQFILASHSSAISKSTTKYLTKMK